MKRSRPVTFPSPLADRSDAVGRYLRDDQVALTPEWYEPDAAWKAEQVWRILSVNGVKPRSICDVGCGTGGVLERLQTLLFDPASDPTRLVGYDVSPQALSLAPESRTKCIELFNEDFMQGSEHFDVVLLLDVFEHVEDYLGFLRRLRDRADLFVFHIPLDLSVQNAMRPGSFAVARHVLGHLHPFSRETALATLGDAGYDVLAEEFTAPRVHAPGPTMRAQVARVPRYVAWKISPAFAARYLGGFELIVLARASTDRTT